MQLGATLAGCVDTGPGEPAFERASAAVVGGESSPHGTSDDAVLLLRTLLDGEELVCSAGLVAKNLALTARHCVSHLVTGAFACSVQGELEEAEEVPEPGTLGVHLPADSLEFYAGPRDERELVARGREVISTLSETICVNDIAFVVLDRELELPVFPLRRAGRARLGEAVTLLGYGLDEAMADSARVPWTALERNRKSDLTIFDVGPELVRDVTSAPPRTIVLEGPSGCLGDSGGPLFANRTRAVLGVYSVLAGTDCLQPSVRHWFSHVPSFEALTDEAFAAAGAEPLLEMAAGGQGGADADAGEAGAAGDAAGAAAELGSAGHAGARETTGGSAGEPSSSGGNAQQGGRAGTTDHVPSPRKGSSGCTLAGASPKPQSSLLLVFVAAVAVLTGRRRQCRPSSGSASG